MKKRIISFIIMIFLVISFITVLAMKNTEVLALSKYGSRGSEVKTIQEKLKRWGYYTGSVDGVYGSLTVSAVKKFQQKKRVNCRWNCWNKNIICYGNNK